MLGQSSVVNILFTRRLILTHAKRISDDDSHNDSVDGDSFAEDYTDEILGANSRSLHTGAEDASTGGENTPEKRNKQVKISLHIETSRPR